MERKIYVDLELIEDNYLSSDAVCVYYAFMMNEVKGNDIQILNTNQIGYWLYRKNIERKEIECIKRGIKELVDKNIIKIVYKISKSDVVYDISRLKQSNNAKKFTYIYEDDITSIMNINSTVKQKNILLYYTYLMYSMLKGGFDEKYLGKISIVGKERVSAYCMFSKRRGDMCCCELEKNNIIAKIRSVNTSISNSNGRKFFIKNVYSRNKDKELCKLFIEERKSHVVNDTSFNKQNAIRSAITRYEWMKRGKEYSEEEVREIYSIVKEWNEEKEREWIDANDPDLPAPKFKDLSIFEKYGLGDERCIKYS